MPTYALSFESLRSAAALPLLILGFLAGCAATPPSQPPSATTPQPTPVAFSQVEVTPPRPGEPLAIAVFKQRRELVLMHKGTPLARFPIQLSTRPEGHKIRQGDLRTPEGRYKICQIKPSRFRVFMWIDYPNLADAQQGLVEGRLSRGQYVRIAEALEAGTCPPPDTPLGGVVGIHGDYEDPPRRYDWTEGCIALTRNDDLMRLARLVPPGTPVTIHP